MVLTADCQGTPVSGQNHLHHTLNHVALLIRTVVPVEVADGPNRSY